MIGVLWAYEGWQYVTFSAGETINAQRNFPRALLIGSSALIGIYLVANLADTDWRAVRAFQLWLVADEAGTILSNSPIPADEVWNVFVAALDANNWAVYQVGRYWKLVEKKQSSRANVPIYLERGQEAPPTERQIHALFQRAASHGPVVQHAMHGVLVRNVHAPRHAAHRQMRQVGRLREHLRAGGGDEDGIFGLGAGNGGVPGEGLACLYLLRRPWSRYYLPRSIPGYAALVVQLPFVGEPLLRIEAPAVLGEDVKDEVSEIDQDPAPGRAALPLRRQRAADLHSPG